MFCDDVRQYFVLLKIVCFSVCPTCHRNRDEQKSAISMHVFEKIPLDENPISGDKRETDA
jgi:hypothetical protein